MGLFKPLAQVKGSFALSTTAFISRRYSATSRAITLLYIIAMVREYKIYYNDSMVLLTDELRQSNKKFTKVITGEKDADAFFTNSLQLFDGVTNENILIVTDQAEQVMRRFLENVKLVIAGGGIVSNEKDELLLIYRRKKWDLPKGKIDGGEKIRDGAVREVTEETEVKIESVEKDPELTYHAYHQNDKNYLKETSWFEMKAVPGQNKPVPQEEEDIEEVRWVKKSDLKRYKPECYPLIWDLLEKRL
jgi:8-oxo-dGTP pyrophosphatase MutT (NUDIX family)